MWRDDNNSQNQNLDKDKSSYKVKDLDKSGFGPELPDQQSPVGSVRLELRDVQLISRVAQGDLRAFDALYRQFFPRLVRFLSGMTRSTAIIEEVINDTLFVVWDKAGTYNYACRVSTWIFSIAYRTALKKINRTDEPVEMDFELIAAAMESEPDSRLSHRQLQQCVCQALDAIPSDQRTVVSLAYYHGMGYEEIARIMDCPVNTIKSRMFHARKRLKNLLSHLMA